MNPYRERVDMDDSSIKIPRSIWRAARKVLALSILGLLLETVVCGAVFVSGTMPMFGASWPVFWSTVKGTNIVVIGAFAVAGAVWWSLDVLRE